MCCHLPDACREILYLSTCHAISDMAYLCTHISMQKAKCTNVSVRACAPAKGPFSVLVGYVTLDFR